MADEDRWPPVHDFEGLEAYIDELVRRDAFSASFWSVGDLQDTRLPRPCHGDVIALLLPSRLSPTTVNLHSSTTGNTGW